jgi:hypothetical protein
VSEELSYAEVKAIASANPALLNAVDRLIEGYEAERERIRRDLALAQGQLRDYQARLGGGFAHEAYLKAQRLRMSDEIE